MPATRAATAPTARAWLSFVIRSALIAFAIGALAVWLDYRFIEDAPQQPLTARRWVIGAVVWGIMLSVLTWLGRSAARAAGSDSVRRGRWASPDVARPRGELGRQRVVAATVPRRDT